MEDADQFLTSNREDWLRWLGHTSGDTRNDQIHGDRQKGGQDRGKSVLGTTVLWHLDELLDHPTNKVIPAESSRERETRNDRVEGLGFQFLSHKFDSVNGGFEHRRHGKFYTVYVENFYSGNNSSFSTNFLYFFRLTISDFAKICSSSSSESPSVLLSESSSPVSLNDLYSELVHPSGTDVLITINSIF